MSAGIHISFQTDRQTDRQKERQTEVFIRPKHFEHIIIMNKTVSVRRPPLRCVGDTVHGHMIAAELNHSVFLLFAPYELRYKLQPAMFPLSQRITCTSRYNATLLTIGQFVLCIYIVQCNTDFMSQILYINRYVDLEFKWHNDLETRQSILISRMTSSSVIIPYREV